MPIEILMPALSPTMTEGTLATWHVKEGDTITSGMVLAEIETDKATMEVEAVDEGVLAKILIPAGSAGVAVNTPIAVLLEEGEDASALTSGGAPKPAAAPAPEAEASAPAAAPAPQAALAPAPIASSGGRIIASPLAKRIAAQHGLDLSAIPGTGPHGRIVKADVEKALAGGGPAAKPAAAPAVQAPASAAASAPAPAPVAVSAPSAAAQPVTAMKGLTLDDPILKLLPPFEAVPNSNMRKTIARRLTESARDIPHFNLQMDVTLDALLALRKQLNERPGADYKLSVNDLVIKATALALTRVPDVNVAYTDGAILRFARVDMAIAVAIDGGLITPIIKDCASKGLATISREAKELAAKARDGKLKPEEYQGGTFSISNLGMFGVKGFTSIINPPQGAILSVGAGEERAVVKGGAIAIANVMTLNLAVDHRCIDGAAGAAFLKELKGLIEDPIALML